MKNIKIHTHGCKLNSYDSGLIEQRLNTFHKQVRRQDSDKEINLNEDKKINIINSCAVTAEATKEAIRLSRKLKKLDSNNVVVLTGCAAQVDGDLVDNIPSIDFVVANSNKEELPRIIDKISRGQRPDSNIFRSNIFKKYDLGADGGLNSKKTRSFLKIQDGCNSFCSFCVIPYARGLSKSLSVTDIIKQINQLHDKGVLEVVLTGVHIGDYISDDNENLDDLVEKILINTSIPRIRLSSLEPIEISDRLLDLYKNERLCKHFHLSIQSANTKILKGMKRKYGATEVEDIFFKINKNFKNAFIGMDVIVGFPGESEEDFLQTYDLLKASDWSRVHVFPYSERNGTKAVEMEGSVFPHERKLRAQKLRELSTNRFHEKAKKQISTLKSCISLKQKEGASFRRFISKDYWHIDVPVKSHTMFFDESEEVNIRVEKYVLSEHEKLEGRLTGMIEQNKSNHALFSNFSNEDVTFNEGVL